jgi:hypothetical protein
MEHPVVKVRWKAPEPPGAEKKNKRKTNGAFPFWDRTRAMNAMLEIFPAGFGGNSDD